MKLPLEYELSDSLKRSEHWIRGKDSDLTKKDSDFKLRHTRHYKLIGAIGIIAIGLCAYSAYKIVDSGNKIIDRWVERMSEYMPVEK